MKVVLSFNTNITTNNQKLMHAYVKFGQNTIIYSNYELVVYKILINKLTIIIIHIIEKSVTLIYGEIFSVRLGFLMLV